MFTRALYYPSIHLPDNQWLRRAILYWDEVNAIVPEAVASDIPRDHVSRTLKAAGVCRWISPEEALEKTSVQDTIDEFVAAVSREEYLRSSGSRDQYIDRTRIHVGKIPVKPRKNTSVHPDKVSLSFEERMTELGLIVGRDNEGWLLMKRSVGDLYLAFLAGAIARLYGLEPITDRWHNDNVLVCSQLETNPAEHQVMTKFILEDLLPAPSEDASVKKILEFRVKHEEELLRFRRAIREFIESLEGLSNQELLERLDAKKDDVREQSLMLARKLKENRLGTTLSVLEVSVPNKAEGLTALISLPMGAVIGGINAAMRVGRQVFEGRVRRNSLLAENPYTYVYRIRRQL
jgi:hypothetical protein